MQKTFILLIIFLGLIHSLEAQSGGNSGSPYSAFGIGDLIGPGFGQTEAFSGTGIGLRSPYFVNNTNPAALTTSIERPVSMIFDFGLNFSANRSSGDENSPFQIDGGLSNINLWFRFNQKWSSDLGMQPYSKLGYTILANRYDESAGGDYSVIYTGKGGVNRLYWGNAYQLTTNLSVGANVNLLFGTIEDAQNFRSTGTLGSFTVNSKNYLKGSNYDLGLQYHIPLGRKALTLGLIYAAPVSLTAQKSTQLLTAQDTLEQDLRGEDAFRIPQKFGGGFSYKGSERWNIAADVTFQNWSQGRLNEDLELLDTRSVSFGAEFIPAYDKYLGYDQQTLLRAGFRWQNSYLKVDDRRVNEWQMSLGLGIPFNRFRHHLNVSYVYNHRGSQSTSAIQQVKHQLSFNVSLRDIWFLRPKYQ